MKEALNLLKEIDGILSLGEKGLAKVSESEDLEKEIKAFLKNSLDSNSELGREYEKWSKATWWKTQSRDGFANDSHLAPLKRLREFLTKLLDASEVKVSPSQQYVQTGNVYTGRKVLRNILSQAKNKIDIQDNYLDYEVFSILEPYFQNNTNLSARLLTSDKAKNSFRSDFSLFTSQFGKVEARTHDQAHGRFIIIDSIDVFSVGHSLKDIGKKADVVSKVENKDAKKQAIDDFESWWAVGKEVKAQAS
jgi:hypothetical protein